MSAYTFDTYSHIKKMKETGAPEPFIEAIANMVRESRDFDLSFLATKTDVNELKSEIEKVELRLEAKIAGLETRLTKWFVSIILLQILLPYIHNILNSLH